MAHESADLMQKRLDAKSLSCNNRRRGRRLAIRRFLQHHRLGNWHELTHRSRSSSTALVPPGMSAPDSKPANHALRLGPYHDHQPGTVSPEQAYSLALLVASQRVRRGRPGEKGTAARRN